MVYRGQGDGQPLGTTDCWVYNELRGSAALVNTTAAVVGFNYVPRYSADITCDCCLSGFISQYPVSYNKRLSASRSMVILTQTEMGHYLAVDIHSNIKRWIDSRGGSYTLPRNISTSYVLKNKDKHQLLCWVARIERGARKSALILTLYYTRWRGTLTGTCYGTCLQA